MRDPLTLLDGKPTCVSDPGTLCARVYDLTHVGWLADGSDVFIAKPAAILLIILIALAIRSLLHRMIRKVTRSSAEGRTPGALRPLRERSGLTSLFDGTIVSERRRQRAEAVGSILRSVVSFVVLMLTFVLVLGELGVNLAPILASAGVVGVAIGFGAQSLVKDFLAGIFMILEDQYGVGDVIDVDDVSGTVEDVGLRTMRLRDDNGTVWYVRNGAVSRVGNKSQGYGQVVLDLPFPRNTDIERAGAVLKDVADGMWRDESWAEFMIEEPELLGVEKLTT
ncbi:MAG TPA: mechanosensitive ion channel domain-containing protein, partial [Mycobacteriales bacterium]|nr:mechanosensitive ion channel domain-containing protein [Mycobacteriales bacterium]